MKFNNLSRVLCPVLVVLALQACQTRAYPPLVRARSVEIPRFMGDWYVLGCIPSIVERHEFNAVESYHLDPAGRILTVFTFNEGSFDGPLKRYTPVGFVASGRSRQTIGYCTWRRTIVRPSSAARNATTHGLWRALPLSLMPTINACVPC
jgi:hypothetical protein